ncbi:MAG: sugar ABC transporter permease [Duodenibacillus sp.]|nr:sugar ABC transporter permease [Duodenibacillus sp.]
MKRIEEKALWLANPFMLSPAVGCLLLFFILPMIATVVVSFTDWQLGGQGEVHFVGLKNYLDLWTSEEFRKSVRNTFFMTAVVVPTSFVLALALALAIRASGRLAQLWQTIYFLPVTASLVAMAVVWQWILHPEVGFVAVILTHLGVTENINLLNDPDYVLWTLSFITVWQMAGYFMILFLTGLVQIPPELYDAAKVDGANTPLALFSNITWPLLGPTSFFIVILTIIKTFQVFDIVKVLTRGGPEKASEILLYTMYQEGFSFFRMGTAAAVAAMYLAVMLVLTWLQTHFIGRRIHYGFQ